MQTNLELDWADGSYDFKLTWSGCAEIERKSAAGIQSVYERVMLGQAWASDVSEIIRQGLLGGSGGLVDGQPVETKGKTTVVNALLERYVTGPDACPFAESWNLAKVIINTYLVGYEPAQKKSAEPEAKKPSRVRSTKRKSSPTAP